MKNIIPTLALVILCVSAANGQSPALVITNTQVIDVRNGKVQPGMSVLIQHGVIEQMAPQKKLKIPAGTQVIDGAGKYLMPGMVDGHIHFFQSGGLYTRPDALNLTRVMPYSKELEFTFNSTTDYFRRYLRLGITTIADVGGPFKNFIIRDSVSKANTSPDVLVTGPLFSMVDNKPLDLGDAPIVKTTTIAAADSLMDKMLQYKPNFIKIWYIVTPDLPAEKTFPVVQHIAKRTHAANLKLLVHATELNTARLAVDAGADILVHSVSDEIIPGELVRKLVEKKISYIPTLVVLDGYRTAFTGKLPHHAHDLYWANPVAYGSLSDPEGMNDNVLPPALKYFRKNAPPPSWAKSDSVSAINLSKLMKAGVNVVTGTDAGNIGTMHASSYYQELQAMRKAGLSPADVLRASTINASLAFGRNAGAVEKGREADLLLLAKNPLENIEHLNTLDLVINNGNVLKADTLIRETPEMVVQRQLNAYNARNLEAFLDTYAESIALYDYPDKLIGRGKEEMRKMYSFFSKVPDLHCRIVKRIVLNNKIIDHESVRVNNEVFEAIAVYEVSDGKIVRVTFVR